jgi:hypothetical protein
LWSLPLSGSTPKVHSFNKSLQIVTKLMIG